MILFVVVITGDLGLSSRFDFGLSSFFRSCVGFSGRNTTFLPLVAVFLPTLVCFSSHILFSLFGGLNFLLGLRVVFILAL